MKILLTSVALLMGVVTSSDAATMKYEQQGDPSNYFVFDTSPLGILDANWAALGVTFTEADVIKFTDSTLEFSLTTYGKDINGEYETTNDFVIGYGSGDLLAGTSFDYTTYGTQKTSYTVCNYTECSGKATGSQGSGTLDPVAVSTVPLPASLPLLFAAGGLIWGFGRRRATR